jgi:hypothetical protein
MKESHEIGYITRTYRYDYVDRIISQSDGSSAPDEFVYDGPGNLISRGQPHALPGQQASTVPAPASAGHFCGKCGTVVEPGKKFCPQCGEKVN